MPSTGVTTMSEVAIGSGYHGEAAALWNTRSPSGSQPLSSAVERADLHRETPALALALDVNQVIARAAVLAARAPPTPR